MKEEKWGGKVDDKHRPSFTGPPQGKEIGEKCVEMEKQKQGQKIKDQRRTNTALKQARPPADPT